MFLFCFYFILQLIARKYPFTSMHSEYKCCLRAKLLKLVLCSSYAGLDVKERNVWMVFHLFRLFSFPAKNTTNEQRRDEKRGFSLILYIVNVIIYNNMQCAMYVHSNQSRFDGGWHCHLECFSPLHFTSMFHSIKCHRTLKMGKMIPFRFPHSSIDVDIVSPNSYHTDWSSDEATKNMDHVEKGNTTKQNKKKEK